MGPVHLDGIEADVAGGDGGACEQFGELGQFSGLEGPALRPAQAVEARRADGDDTVGVVPLCSLVPQLGCDGPALAVDTVDHPAPAGQAVITGERRNGRRVARGGVG